MISQKYEWLTVKFEYSDGRGTYLVSFYPSSKTENCEQFKNRKMKYLYRMTHIDNISHILEHGITHQSSINCNPNYVNIGNSSLIERRNRMDIVTVDGHTYSLKDYIPFYFYARMPMLYNIQHGYMVDKVSPDDIVYMVLDINKVVVDYKHDFFFSDGHAYNHYLTRFYSSACFDNIDNILDKDAIKSDYWRDDSVVKNKKQAEFFVKGDIEVDTIVFYICHSDNAKNRLVDMGINPSMIRVSSRAYY